MVAEFQDARSFGGPSLIVVSPGFDGDRRAFFCVEPEFVLEYDGTGIWLQI